MYKFGQEELEAIGKVLESGWLFRYGGESQTLRQVEQFEQKWAERMQVPYAVAVTSGTAALICSLIGLGIGPGDEVIVPGYTFIATAAAVLDARAVPVIAEIDETLTLDVADVRRKITPRTKAIIPVHMAGIPCNLGPLLELAREHGLYVIEDACQAIGAEYKGRRAGSLGDYGCFSFYPSKNLNGAGDGGMVVTNDAARAEKLRMMRVHGETSRYHHRWVGGNFRFDAIQAAVITTKLAHLDGWTAARQANAERYGKLFQEAGLIGTGILSLPEVKTTRHVFNQYVVRVAPRDALKDFLAAKDIGTAIYYPVPLHRQECFAYLGYREGDLPESEKAARETLALPVYPELTAEQARHVVAAVGALDQPS